MNAQEYAQLPNLIGRAYLEHGAWYCAHEMTQWRPMIWCGTKFERRDCKHCDSWELR